MFINDDERDLHQDHDDWSEEPAPREPVSKYCHNRTGEDNADTHLRRQIMGREIVVAITNGRLDSGSWEQISAGSLMGGAGNGCWSRLLASDERFVAWRFSLQYYDIVDR